MRSDDKGLIQHCDLKDVTIHAAVVDKWWKHLPVSQVLKMIWPKLVVKLKGWTSTPKVASDRWPSQKMEWEKRKRDTWVLVGIFWVFLLPMLFPFVWVRIDCCWSMRAPTRPRQQHKQNNNERKKRRFSIGERWRVGVSVNVNNVRTKGRCHKKKRWKKSDDSRSDKRLPLLPSRTVIIPLRLMKRKGKQNREQKQGVFLAANGGAVWQIKYRKPNKGDKEGKAKKKWKKGKLVGYTEQYEMGAYGGCCKSLRT